MAYTKLDSSLTESTIWQAPDATRLVWITMLSMADQNGYVGASVPGLAGRARVNLQDCITAVQTLESPDEWSRTKDHEGRRITPADGGWVLLNHAKFRAIQSADDRRERSRVAMAELRHKRKQQALTLKEQTPTVNGCEHELTKLPQAEAEAEAKELTPSPSAQVFVETASPPATSTYKRPNCPTSEIVALYHAALPSLPVVEILTEQRKSHISARWAQVCADAKYDRKQGLDWFEWFFGHVSTSQFLMGKVKGRNNGYFRCTLDFLMTPEKFARVIEGFYHAGHTENGK
jgi:hypothetical protein